MSLVEMTWLGGPQDGGTLLVQDRFAEEAIKVIYGSKKHPEEMYVTPRLQGDKWVLPFYEGKKPKKSKKNKETR